VNAIEAMVAVVTRPKLLAIATISAAVQRGAC
jgi:hypothetical protein